MTSNHLENLVKTGSLRVEPASESEYKGLVCSAKARLVDARNSSLATESRFDLAYNASHALSLAALRRLGYRSDNRYLVFQCLQHTLDIESAVWRVLAHCHQKRNLAEYEGYMEVDEQLIKELIQAADSVLKGLIVRYGECV